MNTISEFNLILYLASIVLKSTIIFTIAKILIISFRNFSPIYRNIIYKITIITVLLFPLLEFILPKYEINQTPAILHTTFVKIHSFSVQNIAPSIITKSSISFSEIFILIWFIGTLFLLLKILLGWILTKKIITQSTQIDNFTFNKIKTKTEKKLSIRQPIIYASSTIISSPIAIGWLRYRIILPTYTLNWSEDKIGMILTHELAHIKRHDTVWFIISIIMTSLYWINPLAWILRKNFILDSEIICDDFVLLNGSDAHSYAESLLTIVNNIKKNRKINLVSINMARKTELEDRLMSIVRNSKREVKINSLPAKLFIILTIVIVLPLVGLQVFARDTNSLTTFSSYLPKTQKNVDNKNNNNYPKVDDFVVLTIMPKMVKSTSPEYPQTAKKKGIEGDVWVKSLIDKTGKVVKAEVGKSSGNTLLDKSALEAAFKFKYLPGIQDDKPVACWVSYKVTFKLDNEKKK